MFVRVKVIVLAIFCMSLVGCPAPETVEASPRVVIEAAPSPGAAEEEAAPPGTPPLETKTESKAKPRPKSKEAPHSAIRQNNKKIQYIKEHERIKKRQRIEEQRRQILEELKNVEEAL